MTLLSHLTKSWHRKIQALGLCASMSLSFMAGAAVPVQASPQNLLSPVLYDDASDLTLGNCGENGPGVNAETSPEEPKSISVPVSVIFPGLDNLPPAFDATLYSTDNTKLADIKLSPESWTNTFLNVPDSGPYTIETTLNKDWKVTVAQKSRNLKDGYILIVQKSSDTNTSFPIPITVIWKDSGYVKRPDSIGIVLTPKNDETNEPESDDENSNAEEDETNGDESDDGNPNNNKTPTDVRAVYSVNLTSSSEATDPYKVTLKPDAGNAQNNTWKGQTELPLFEEKNGQNFFISYNLTITNEGELKAAGYAPKLSGTSIDGFELTLTRGKMGSVTVETIWIGDSAFVRPDSLNIKFFHEEYNGITLTLDNKNNWSSTVTNLVTELPDGQKLTWEVDESVGKDELHGYTKQVFQNENDYIIANFYGKTTNNISIPIEVNWKDKTAAEDFEELFIQLSSHQGTKVDSRKVNDPKWSYTFENLPRIDATGLIVYEAGLTEKSKEALKEKGLASKVNGNAEEGYTITIDKIANTEVLDIKVKKVWNDNGYSESTRPQSVTVYLKENTEIVGKKSLTKDSGTNGWEGTFEEFPKTDSNGDSIDYFIEEKTTDLSNYTSKVTGSITEGFTVTNTRTTRKFPISIIWNSNLPESSLPKEVNVQIFKGGSPDNVVTLTSANKVTTVNGKAKTTGTSEIKWETYVQNLPYSTTTGSDTPIQYTVKLVEDDTLKALGCKTEIKGNMTDGFTIENTLQGRMIGVKVIWNDNNDASKKQPTSLTVALLANNEQTTTTTVSTATEWKGNFTVQSTAEDGKTVEYSVKIANDSALKSLGYTTTITGNATSGFTITNTLESGTSAATNGETTTVSGAITWEDNNDAAKLRPSVLTVRLLANGKQVSTTSVKASDQWKFNFAKMAVKDDSGQAITYTVEEETPANYTSKISYASTASGVTVSILNTINSQSTLRRSVSVTKQWADNNDANKKRPSSITMVLYANNISTGKSLELTAAKGWAGTFDNLDVYASNALITYSIKEVTVTNYTDKTSGDMTDGFVVTNTYTGASSTGTSNFGSSTSGSSTSGSTNSNLVSSLTPDTSTGTSGSNVSSYQPTVSPNQSTTSQNSSTAASSNVWMFAALLVLAAGVLFVLIWMRRNNK